MVLVQLSVVEQRLDAVRAVLAGATATEVAAAIGVSRQSVHTWIARYQVEGLGGLADRSRRPASCPHQVSTVVEVKVAEMRGSIRDGFEADPDGAAPQAGGGSGGGAVDGHDQPDLDPSGSGDSSS